MAYSRARPNRGLLIRLLLVLLVCLLTYVSLVVWLPAATPSDGPDDGDFGDVGRPFLLWDAQVERGWSGDDPDPNTRGSVSPTISVSISWMA